MSQWAWRSPQAPERRDKTANRGRAAERRSKPNTSYFFRQIGFELVERSRPTGFVALPAFFIVQPRMGESDFGAFGHGAQRDLDARLAGIPAAERPAPAHHDPRRRRHFEELAAALVLETVFCAEADTIAAAGLW